MLTPEQKAEAEKRLKNMNEERSQEEEIKQKIKKSIKIINDAINSMKSDPKKQIEILKNLANQQLLQKISLQERTSTALIDAQEKMKNERQKYSREALILLEEKGKFEGGIQEIKKTILNIQKTVQESVQEEVKKRGKIEADLEKSLDEIRGKIKEFEEETQKLTTENKELQQKIEELKTKLNGIEDSYKEKAEQKDKQNLKQREQLTEKLKELQVQVEKATQLSKEYTALQKKNFDNKIALYLKTKKFPQFFSSFENSADTLNSCKQELLKGVQRINTANELIAQYGRASEETNNLFLAELRIQKQKQNKIDGIKKEKEGVRANIIVLQNKLKEKKEKA